MTIGGVRLPESVRLKLYRLENHTAKPMVEFNLCDVKGAGALYQVTIAGRGLRETGAWKTLSFLEACMRAYVDGSTEPVLLSSGLQDYFLGTYYFNQGRYANNLAGLTHLDVKNRTFSPYRFHDQDPVFFNSGLWLTCRCGETEDGSKHGETVGDRPRRSTPPTPGSINGPRQRPPPQCTLKTSGPAVHARSCMSSPNRSIEPTGRPCRSCRTVGEVQLDLVNHAAVVAGDSRNCAADAHSPTTDE